MLDDKKISKIESIIDEVIEGKITDMAAKLKFALAGISTKDLQAYNKLPGRKKLPK